MLEVLNEIDTLSVSEAKKVLKEEDKKNPMLIEFLRICCKDENKFMSPSKIFRMMKYYQLEKANEMDGIGEIGDFVVEKVDMLKKRDFANNCIELKMTNAIFLIDTYNKLREEMLHRNQYKILRNSLLLLNSNDIKWFTRIICKKIKWHEGIMELSKNNM